MLQRFSLVAGFLVAVAGGWLLMRAPESGNSPDGRLSRDSTLELPPIPSLDFGEKPATEVETAGEVLPEGAMRGHRVWHGDDLDALEAAARAAGLRILGRIPALGLLHVAGSEDQLRRGPPRGGDETFVYPVTLPPHPSAELLTLEGLKSFGSSALAAIGIASGDGTRGAGVRVAVLDTGIEAHAALANANLTVKGSASGSGHGTAVAALIAGSETYAQGIAPGVTLLDIPVLDASGTGDTFSAAEGIIEAVDRGAQIISLSAGSLGASSVLREAVDYAEANGVVIVAASGNDGAGVVRYPAAYDSVIAVTSVDADWRPPSFANQGESIDVAAPGVGVYTAWTNEDYVAMSGSSVATPLVSGALAAIISDSSGMSALEARSLLLANLNELGPLGEDVIFGGGALDLGRIEQLLSSGSVVDLAATPPYVALDEAVDASVPVYVGLQNQGSEMLTGARLELTVNGSPYSYDVGALAPGGSSGAQLRLSLSDLEAEGGVVLESRVVLPGGETDDDPSNDAIMAALSVFSDSDE